MNDSVTLYFYKDRCGPPKFDFRDYIQAHWYKTIIEETQHIRGPLGFDPDVSLVFEFNGKTVKIPLDKFKTNKQAYDESKNY